MTVETNGKLPRKETKLTERQERFLNLLTEGKTRREAVREAGYDVTDDKSADSRASELMRNPKVYAAYVDRCAELSAAAVMDGVKWIEYLRFVAVEAMRERDWNGAVAALREIGKHLGLYEKDHQQKRAHTEADVERMRAELVKRGFDMSRRNFPTNLGDA